MAFTRGSHEAQELSDFEGKTAAQQNRQLFIILREVSGELKELRAVVMGGSINAWLMRGRNLLTLCAPLAAVAVVIWRG